MADNSQLAVMLTCSVCQDIFRDPRQLPCGHSFCMACLESLIDFTSDVPFRCPDCRTYFGSVIGVQKSYALACISEQHRENNKAKQKKSVFCDCCPEKMEPAIKSCLKCEVSLCKEHLQPHLECQAFLGHTLVPPLGNLSSRRCLEHKGQVLKYYCSVSKTYVCNICALERNQRNLAEESSTVLEGKLTDLMNQQYNSVKQTVENCKESVIKIKEEIRQELTTHSKDLWINLVTVLLLGLWFISVYYAHSLSVDNQILQDKLQKQQSQLHDMYRMFAEKSLNSPSHGQRNGDNVGDFHVLSLNIDSASAYLKVSPDLQSVERVKTKLPHSSHPARFEKVPQVLSSQCVSSGRHVWVVEAEGYWDIAVSYTSIQRKRKGKDGAAFGVNAKSWSLMRNDIGQLFAYHNNSKKILNKTLNHNKVAVVVDFGKDIISFLEVGATNNQLHEFKAQLTEPVCLGIGLYRVDPHSRVSIITA
ncbi:nuclear factor 7, ovary-like [Osmerus eperlanus]|uniref:nuclear factor 7, ovary-like n=1 Tax=Osmerus eperlanus TaxID=29151 RepID=UPI002E148EDA